MKYFLPLFLAVYLCASSLAEPANPKFYLQMIYENKGGYTIPHEEINLILAEGGHPQYGEITYDSAAHILDDLDLSRQDVFYDLGSGIGKLVLQVYLTTAVKKSIGVELSATRWAIAESCRKKVMEDDNMVSGRDLIFLNQNISATNLSDATVCFISGIVFPRPFIQSLMDRLSALGHHVKVISVLPLPKHPRFTLIKTYNNLPMSWAPEGVDVCLYQVTPTQLPRIDALEASSKRAKRWNRRAQ